MNDIEFGLHLKELRKRQGVTQSELAEKTGLSVGGINKFEKGKTSISLKNIQAIAAALNVSVYDLVGAAEDPEQRAQYNAAHPVGAALDTILDSYGYSIIYESETPYLVGKGERLRLSDQFLVQIEILKEKARKAAADGE